MTDKPVIIVDNGGRYSDHGLYFVEVDSQDDIELVGLMVDIFKACADDNGYGNVPFIVAVLSKAQLVRASTIAIAEVFYELSHAIPERENKHTAAVCGRMTDDQWARLLVAFDNGPEYSRYGIELLQKMR